MQSGRYSAERSAGNATRVGDALSDDTDLAVDRLSLGRVEHKQSLARRTRPDHTHKSQLTAIKLPTCNNGLLTTLSYLLIHRPQIQLQTSFSRFYLHKVIHF